MERIEQDETIDLQKLFAIIVDRKKLFGGIVAGFTAVALIISLLLPKEYTSQVTVQTASGDMGMGGAAAAMAAVFCGVTNCPITTLLISFELFGFSGIPYFMIAISLSYLLSGYKGLYSDQIIVYSKYRPHFINRHVGDESEDDLIES